MRNILIIILFYIIDLIIELSDLSISSVSVKQLEQYSFLYPFRYMKARMPSFLMLNLIYSNLIQYFIGRYTNDVSGTSILIISCLSVYLNVVLRSCVLHHPEPVAYLLSYIMFIPGYLFQFSGWILAKIGYWTLRIMGINQIEKIHSVQAYRKELLWDIGVHANLASEMEELKIIKSALQFRDVEVYKIMTESEHFVTIMVDRPISDLISYVQQIDKQRNLIAINRLGQIIGTISQVDILSSYIRDNNCNIYRLIKSPLFISQHATINALTKHFVSSPKSSLFVVDQAMNIIGIITLHDVVQEIFGIEDDNQYYYKTDDGYILDADYNTRILNRKMNWHIPDQYITLGDFISFLLAGSLVLNKEVTWENMSFKIVGLKNNQPHRIYAKVVYIQENVEEEAD